jgi:hypothetical protein
MAKHKNKSNQSKANYSNKKNQEASIMHSAKESVSNLKDKVSFSGLKNKVTDAIPSTEAMKDSLPAILSWGAVALGAVGMYALYRNRGKIQSFIQDTDISLPFFNKGEEGMEDSSFSKGKDQSNDYTQAAH